MSTTITATTYTDPLLQSIRNQVKTKDDGTPWLLMPVKIETRFMRVDKPLFEPDPFTDILVDIFKWKDYVRFNPFPLPPHEVLGRLRNILDQFDKINTGVPDVKRLTRKEKGWLNERSLELEQEAIQLNQRLGGLDWADEQAMSELRVLKAQLGGRTKAITDSISKLSLTRTSKFAESTAMLGAIEDITEAMEKMAGKKLSSKDRTEKRKLFAFLDEQFAKVEQGLTNFENLKAVNMVSTSSQLKQLTRMTEAIPDAVKDVTKNLSKLQSEYKQNEYTERLSSVNEKLATFHGELDRVVRPKIEMQRALRTIDARDVMYRTLSIADNLKVLNQRPFRSYSEIKSTRVRLYKELHSLRDEMHRIVEGGEEEFDAISKAWDVADAELETFTKRVGVFKGKDRHERAGVSRTITHINKEYRRDLAGLKTGNKSAFPVLCNLSLEKSVVAYNDTLKRLNELNETMSTNANSPAAKEAVVKAMKEVSKLDQAFNISSRDIHVLPKKTFDALKTASVDLQGNINSVIENSDSPNGPDISTNLANKTTKAIASIQTGVEAQYTDTLDRKDRFYDEERNQFVWATKTVTEDQLWVRIYPDDIAIHTHEEVLTQEEVDDGKAYWLEIAAAGDDADLKLAAWRAISTAYGSQRAAWIVRTMKPVPTAVPADELLLKDSKTLVETNENIAKLNQILAGLEKAEDKDEVLGVAYPYLEVIHKGLSRLKEENSTLLRKTYKLLLVTQSYINGLISELKATPIEEREAMTGRLEVVNQFAKKFAQIIEEFQVTKPVESKFLIKKFVTKNVFPTPTIKDAGWTEAPHSKVMPNRFVVLTMRGGDYKHIKVSKPVPANKLIVGLDPEKFESDGFTYDADGNLIIDDKIKWLTDFKEAEKLGMAVSITLDQDDVLNGFDKLFVIGVKNTTEAKGQELLEDLIDNHHYLPEGASFLPIGTPTNNTKAGQSGYRSFEEDAALSFKVERNNEEPLPGFDPAYPTDASRLAEGLGISQSTLDFLDYASGTEVTDAFNMNKALFPGTLGNYMEEGLDSMFTLGNIDHTKTFFNDYVSARGYLPSIRVGTQPYGVLPTTAFSQFSVTANDANPPILTKTDFDSPAAIKNELQTRYDIRLKELLNILDAEWTTIRTDEKVEHHGNTDPLDPQKHFMNMLGLHAVSQESFYRYGLNVAARQGANDPGDFSINFDPTKEWSPQKVAAKFREHVRKGHYYQSDYFSDEQNPSNNAAAHYNHETSRINIQFEKARVFATRLLRDQAQILGDTIDSRKLSDTVLTPSPVSGTDQEILDAKGEIAYFINWLTTNDAWELHSGNRFSQIVEETLQNGAPSKSLLFLLLRHSICSAYVDTILKILEHEGLMDQRTRKKMGRPGYYYRRFDNGFSYVTKWTYLFSKIDRLDGVLNNNMDNSNGFFNYMYGKRFSSNGYMNRYLSPEPGHASVFNGFVGNAAHGPYVDELTETRLAIGHLKNIPTKKLELLMSEHLDLCTYRLDAWRLGLANQRLKKQRDANGQGIFLGAYGWVEDLRKGGDRDIVQDIPSGLWKNGDGPVYTDDDNQGFIHTPSLNHAITAAILRAGFKSNEATREVENQMAVNLSSERVRMALNLLEGITSGQDASAMLGYQFERGLHERHPGVELDQYIFDFRDKYPLQIAVELTTDLGEITANNVVDGMELLEAAQDFLDDPGIAVTPAKDASIYEGLKANEGDWWNHVNIANVSAASAAKKDAMLKEIDRMADAFDALGDLCISESVYQVAKGNHVRASAILDKLAKGEAPNDVEITATPRTGTVVTHKVGLFIDRVAGIDHVLTESGPDSTPKSGAALATAVTTAGAEATNWTAPFTPRAIAEPTLNKWAGNLIGNPANMKVLVDYTIPEYTVAEVVTPEATISLTVTLASLQLQPLDVIQLFGTGPLDGGAELNDRIATYVRTTIALPVDYTGTADDVTINIKYTKRGAGWNATDFSFYEKAGYIQSLRVLITNSAMLAADDLVIPGEEEVPDDEVRNQDVTELLTRTTNLEARLKIVHTALNTFFTTEIALADADGHTFTNTQVDSLRNLLSQASIFGVPGTIPATSVSYGDKVGIALLRDADGAYKAIGQRLSAAAKNITAGKAVSSSNEARIDALRQACRDLIGKAYMVFPHFTLRNEPDLSQQINLAPANGLMRSAPAFAMEEWSRGIGRVRERLAALETVEMLATNFGETMPVKTPLQFPFELDGADAKDHWLGIDFPTGYTPSEDKLSLVMMNTAAITTNPTQPKMALLLDEWVEIIPNINETTGITFNYDQPDAKPPNTLLLAVTPEETGQWKWDDLVHTLNDTLELAKNRAVEPEHLENTVFGQILPGIMTEIVPPQLLPDDDDGGQENPLGLQIVTDFGLVNDTIEEETEDA